MIGDTNAHDLVVLQANFVRLADPWDARAYGRDIRAHEELARACAGESDSRILQLGAAVACGALIALVACRCQC